MQITRGPDARELSEHLMKPAAEVAIQLMGTHFYRLYTEGNTDPDTALGPSIRPAGSSRWLEWKRPKAGLEAAVQAF